MSKINLTAVFAGIVALLALSGCTVTRVAPNPNFFESGRSPYLFPGYRPTAIESIGSFASDTDMLPPVEFVREVCGDPATEPKRHFDWNNPDPNWHDESDADLDTPSSIWVLSASSGGGGQGGGSSSGGNQGGGGQGNNASGGSQGGGSQGGGVSFGLAPRNGTVAVTDTVNYQIDSTGNPVIDPKTNGYASVDGKPSSRATVRNLPTNQYAITTCSLKVIQTAVNICLVRSSNRNAFDQLQGYSLGGILAMAAAAAGVATAAHANTSDAAIVGAGIAASQGFFQGLQKTVPPLGLTQISAIMTAGLQYLALDEWLTRPLKVNANGDPIYDAARSPEANRDNYNKFDSSYAHLFDASMSACLVASQ